LRSGRVARSATNLVARVSGFSRLSLKVFLNAGFSLRGASVRGRSLRARSEAGRSARGRSEDGRSDDLRSGRPVVGRAPRSVRCAEVRDLPVVGFRQLAFQHVAWKLLIRHNAWHVTSNALGCELLS